MLPTLAICRSAIVASALSLVPATPMVCDRVDVLELNCVYDSDGRLMLRQMIFWDWRRERFRYEVVAWRLWKDDSPEPLRDWETGEFQLLWSDGEVLRSVRARVYWQTWTQHDPELADRQRLSQHLRRGLSRALTVSKSTNSERAQR
jgi:hypothetical protein